MHSMGKGRRIGRWRRYCGTGKGKWISVGEEKEAGKKETEISSLTRK